MYADIQRELASLHAALTAKVHRVLGVDLTFSHGTCAKVQLWYYPVEGSESKYFSRTGEDILALFRELHAQGNTLMVVTHDPTIASRAQRVIHLLDGHVERDVLNPATVDQN